MDDLSGLLGFTPDQLQSAMSMLAPQQADKDAARKQALLALGLGLMSARKGFEGDAISRAGLLGMQAYQNTIQNQVKQRQEALPQLMALRQMAMQNNYMKSVQDALGGPSAAPVPAGAVGGSGIGGGTASLFGPSSQPGPVSPPGPAPVNPQDAYTKLATLNLAGRAMNMPDLAPAIGALFPKMESMRQGAFGTKPNGEARFFPTMPPGYVPVDPNNPELGIKPIPGYMGAQAANAAIPKAVERAYEPAQPRVDQAGNEVQPGGSRLDQMFGPNSPLPYGVPAPAAGTPATGATAPPATPAARPNAFGQLPGEEANDAAMNAQATSIPAPGAVSNVVKQSPAKTAEQEQKGKDVAEYRNAVFAAGDSARSQDATLNEMAQAMQKFTPGPTLPARANVAGYAQELPVVGRSLANALVPNSQDALPAVTAFNKLAVKMTAEQSKVFGSREAQQIVQMVRDAIPNAGMVPGAPQMIFRFMNGMNDWAKARQDALSQWEQAHNGSTEGFRETWEAANPPTKFVPPLDALQSMSSGGAPKLTAAGQGNATVASILRGNPTPSQLQALRAKGYIE